MSNRIKYCYVFFILFFLVFANISFANLEKFAEVAKKFAEEKGAEVAKKGAEVLKEAFNPNSNKLSIDYIESKTGKLSQEIKNLLTQNFSDKIKNTNKNDFEKLVKENKWAFFFCNDASTIQTIEEYYNNKVFKTYDEVINARSKLYKDLNTLTEQLKNLKQECSDIIDKNEEAYNVLIREVAWLKEIETIPSELNSVIKHDIVEQDCCPPFFFDCDAEAIRFQKNWAAKTKLTDNKFIKNIDRLDGLQEIIILEFPETKVVLDKLNEIKSIYKELEKTKVVEIWQK